MAGKFTSGVATNSRPNYRTIKAYAEGAAVGAPTNPHPVGTPENVAYAQGVTDRGVGVSDIASHAAGGQRNN